MTTINANMTSGIGWVPLTEADARAIEPGFYVLDSENIIIGGPHRSLPALPSSPWNGRWCDRAVAGSTAASHSSGATLTRYYPDANAPEGGGLTNPVTEPFNVQPATDEEQYLFFLQAPEGYDEGFGEVIQVQDFEGLTIFGLNVFGQTQIKGAVPELALVHGSGPQVVIRASATQGTMSLTNATGKVLFAAGVLGVHIGSGTEPADAFVATGQMVIWYDATNGSPKLMIKAKQADGTVVAGEVALS